MSDPAIINTLRTHALKIFTAGITAADPYQAVKHCLTIDNGNLEILLNLNDHSRKRIGSWRKVHIIAFGKAACAMAEAAQQSIPVHLLAESGIAVTNYENVRPIHNIEVIGAGHPLPDIAGLAAAKKCASLIRNAKENELVLVLVSGGGSALLPYPVDTITLQEKIATTDLLLSCGATINEINCVRKHLSQLKGGGLTRLAQPADVHALILSDVLGDDLSAIASGPTVPDNTNFTDAIDILKNKNIWEKTPFPVREHLSQGQLGNIQETPKADDPAFSNSSYTLIGSNSVSVMACLNTAQTQGYKAIIYDNNLCGQAREVAEKLAVHVKHLQDQDIKKPVALIAGGETTVTVTGNGRGGRNQEMALAFALAAKNHGLTCNWTFLSGGTDGRDGPTDGAGGLVDPDSLQRMFNANLNPIALLANNDAYRALSSSQDLIITGATGTNVADLQVLLILPSNSNSIND